MSATAARWTEEGLSETPTVELLQSLGYTYAAPETLEFERQSLVDVVLTARLEVALTRLNPWLSEDNTHKAIREIANVHTASLIEANEHIHTALSHGIALEQDRGDGRKSHTVRFIDFDDPTNNELLVTRQYKVKGAKKHIIPDVVCFVNGIPLVVIECKSPDRGDQWRAEALDQLDRYQELSEKYREIGAPKLFEPVQLLIATCGQDAAYGTVATPPRYFLQWKQPYPMTEAAVVKLTGRTTPTPQDILLCGLMSPETLLDLVRYFVTFERDAHTGRTLKKVPRYQQYAAVNKAIERARRKDKPEKRGGVVWHTQGSGKSLTMLWLALKLRQDATHENPTLVLVTDPRDLDDQITRTFRACGYPNPERADSIKALRQLLSGPGGRTVMTTVQKFQEVGGITAQGKRARKPHHPVLSEASNVFVLTDEAHRTQYGSLAANLRTALPNAVFFGFTGTPIDKKDRSTLQTFGSYIDQYTIEQAVADGATVPIYYESRMPQMQVIGQTLDQLFERTFVDRTDEERAAIRQRYATERAVASAPRRIEAIALDLIDHYTKYIQPNGFKAQVVAVTRDAAVTYKEKLDELNAPQSAVIMSASNKDAKRLVKHHTSADERKLLIQRFLDKHDPLQILIVCDMLLTGFDAPIEQVMYLDSALKEHTLLQAIARVNRTAEAKTYGLVVDYWGVSDSLQEALEIFSPSDIKGAMEPKLDELPRLQARHAAAMRFFTRIKDKGNLDACVTALAADDVRADFQAAFRKFSQSMDMMLPDPRALEYASDLAWLGKIRQGARARFRDSTLDISDCGDKVRKLIEQAIIADGVEILVKQVDVFSGDFEKKLNALKSDEAKASEMEHAIRHEIHLKLEEDPAYYLGLRERLEQIVEDRKARRIAQAEQLQLFQTVIDDIKGHSRAAEGQGMSETTFAIFGLLKGTQTLSEAKERSVAAEIDEALEPQLAIIDWSRKNDVQREMRRLIKRRLPNESFRREEQDRLAGQIIDLLKARGGT